MPSFVDVSEYIKCSECHDGETDTINQSVSQSVSPSINQPINE